MPVHYGTTNRLSGRTEVALLGSIHREHLQHRQYSLSVVQQIISELEPEVILVEVPPVLFASEYAQWERSAVGPWFEQFPEVSGAVLPLAKKKRILIEPVSGWTQQIADARSRYREQLPEGPDDRRYQNVRDYVQTELQRTNHEADPVFINSKDYRRLTSWEQRTFASYDEELGEAGVRELLWRHWKLIDSAIKKHEGKRILLLFAAEDIWFFEQAIEDRTDATIIDVRVFVGRVDEKVRKRFEIQRRNRLLNR